MRKGGRGGRRRSGRHRRRTVQWCGGRGSSGTNFAPSISRRRLEAASEATPRGRDSRTVVRILAAVDRVPRRRRGQPRSQKRRRPPISKPTMTIGRVLRSAASFGSAVENGVRRRVAIATAATRRSRPSALRPCRREHNPSSGVPRRLGAPPERLRARFDRRAAETRDGTARRRGRIEPGARHAFVKACRQTND